jgi:hypothetical protein
VNGKGQVKTRSVRHDLRAGQRVRCRTKLNAECSAI